MKLPTWSPSHYSGNGHCVVGFPLTKWREHTRMEFFFFSLHALSPPACTHSLILLMIALFSLPVMLMRAKRENEYAGQPNRKFKNKVNKDGVPHVTMENKVDIVAMVMVPWMAACYSSSCNFSHPFTIFIFLFPFSDSSIVLDHPSTTLTWFISFSASLPV